VTLIINIVETYLHYIDCGARFLYESWDSCSLLICVNCVIGCVYV